MAIVYAPATNIITVTGYTEATPCNFTDIYNADKAGTLSLHARTGITAVDGAAVAVNRAERPADYIVLGGASNDLYITIANWVGTTATIQITGTDRAGNALTEDIVVTANGTYYTTKLFKTITHTQVTVFTATGFDYDLIQGQWGVVWKQGANQFYFTANLRIGDGSTVTWFADTKKQVKFFTTPITSPWHWQIYVPENAHFRLGRVLDATAKSTTDGCSIILQPVSDYTSIQGSTATGIIELYSTQIIGNDAIEALFYYCYNAKVYNCLFVSAYLNRAFDADVYNVTVTDAPYGFVLVTGTIDEVKVNKITKAFHLNTKGLSTAPITKNVIARNNTYLIEGHSAGAQDGYFVNIDSDTWAMTYYQFTNKIYRQYEFDLKVIDKDNTPIQTATVKIWDKDSNLIVDTTTDANGVIATQTISRGYYNQANGDTLQEYTPHTIEISKAGYQTYKKKFTLGAKTDWLIRLRRITELNLSKRCRINM